MNDVDLPRIEFDRLPRSVLCFGVDLAQTVRGCAGLLALHAQRGDRIALALLSGTGSRPVEEALCVSAVHALGLPRGELGAQETLVARLRQVLTDAAPQLVIAPAAAGDPDQAAAARAIAAALARAPEVEVLVVGAGARATHQLDANGADARRDRALAALGMQARPAPTLVLRTSGSAVLAATRPEPDPRLPRATAVVSTWNKKEDVRANLESLRAQTLPFAEIVVVDNASRDGTADAIAREFPEVHLITMPHDRFGACTTFNLGFRAVKTELTAILDDDIVMPPDWLAQSTARLGREPATTAIVSTQVIEPGMPASYRDSPAVNQERYMSTFRGCASLARTSALVEAGLYDERLFIYGNERDLTCRLLNRGYRVLQYPGAHVFHKTPFGIKMGKRSLYYHARNAWISTLKYAPLSDLARMPWLVGQVLLRGERKEAEGSVTDAVGTIGIGRSIRETPGAWWVLVRAGASVLANLPYCLRHRQPCRAPDFELPLS